MHLSSQAGFTMVHLIVTIGVMSLMAGATFLALPALRNNSFDKRVQNDLMQLHVQASLMIAANDGNLFNPKDVKDCLILPNAANCNGAIEGAVNELRYDMLNAGSTGFQALAGTNGICMDTRQVGDTSRRFCIDDRAVLFKNYSCATGTAQCLPD